MVIQGAKKTFDCNFLLLNRRNSMVRGAYFRKNFEDLFSYRGAQKLEWFEVLEGLCQYGLWSFQAGDTKLKVFA